MRIGTLCFLLLGACDRPPSGHTVPEPERTRQITVWTDRFEAFLEHPPIVAGTAATFVTHLTDLATSRPRSEGAVTFVLGREGRPSMEVVVPAPKRPGIYLPELLFPEAGTWSIELRIPNQGGAVVSLPPVQVHAGPEEAKRAPPEEAPEGIVFLKEQQWKLLTRSEPAAKRRLAERLRLPATVLALPGSRASVAAPLSGRLVAGPSRAFPTLGERVEAGQVLAHIQPPVSDLAAKFVDAEAETARARLALEQAILAHERTRKLAEAEARTARELQESEFAVRSARAAHEAAVALRSAYERTGLTLAPGQAPTLELRSPIAGMILRVEAALGEHVPADRPVFIVVDAARVLIEARVPEADVPRIGASRDALLELPGAKGRFLPVLGEGGGRAVLFAPEVDRSTRTVSLLYEMPNPEARLRIGMSLTLHLETARAEDALAVPESALVDEEGRTVAFVQVSGETFEKRDLRLGIRDGGQVQVLEGLAPGERVVTRGAYAVRLASVATSLPAHGHEH